ncbi:hypothetical protein FGO68_gene466 [Halteria grandinella]|uniref:Uncharacterized protein n=1 Tax=Halteria grandinella TaxID=5974 RepID=A0A8J8P245_HALGN|nr:hypothetical protein FGO68_gene466 [Halteria grandinella]
MFQRLVRRKPPLSSISTTLLKMNLSPQIASQLRTILYSHQRIQSEEAVVISIKTNSKKNSPLSIKNTRKAQESMLMQMLSLIDGFQAHYSGWGFLEGSDSQCSVELSRSESEDVSSILINAIMSFSKIFIRFLYQVVWVQFWEEQLEAELDARSIFRSQAWTNFIAFF